MGILNFFRKSDETIEEQLRQRSRKILYIIIEKQKTIQRRCEALQKAAKMGNDPNEIRTDITRLEIEKLDLERELEKIDQTIVEEERKKVTRAA